MSYRTVEDIKTDYHLNTVLFNQGMEEFKKAEEIHERKQNKFYGIYFILFALSSVVIWIATSSFEVFIGYAFMGSVVSLFLLSHAFVAIFTHKSEPHASDYGCERRDRDKYVDSVKRELVESTLQGRIMKIDFDKSAYQVWNLIVSLDKDNKSREYYANFFFDDDTIDVSAREFVAKR